VLDQEYTTKFKPLFDQAVAEVEAAKGADQHLDASIQALNQSTQALTVFMASLIQQMHAVNTHPTVAAKAAP
jgi:2-oxo-4-hydroxy-4-carboxy--5-ureidoimidazoline (OHCU) decarboxylase